MATADHPAPSTPEPRKIVAYSLLSIDGVAEEPGDWMFEVDDAVFSFLGKVIADQDDVLLGRGTYDYWADYWPTSTVEPFAAFINSVPKHVFSSTPLTGQWHNERVVAESMNDYIRNLKTTPGRSIGIHGSITITKTLLAMGLVDEMHLVVVPTIAGKGTRLFPALADAQRLTCTYQSRTASGDVLLSYDVRA